MTQKPSYPKPMVPDNQQATLGDVVTEYLPTEDGKGRLFRMEPGKRIVLDQYDEWELNYLEPIEDQIARLSLSPKEQERQRLGVQRLKERLSRVPFYADAAKRYGDENEYWEGFYDSCINS